MMTTQSTPAFTFQKTVPKQTQFLPTVHPSQKNSVKSVAKAKVQATLTSSALSHHLEETITPPHLPTKHDGPSQTRPIPSKSVPQTNRYESEKYDTDRSTTTEPENNFNAYQLVDITPAKAKHHVAPGRLKKGMFDLFLQKCYWGSQPGKHLHRCIGVGCNVTFSNQNLQQTIKHAHVCNKLPKNLQTKAKQLAAKNALSKRVLDSETEATEQTDNGQDMEHEAKQVYTTKKTEDGRSVPTNK